MDYRTFKVGLMTSQGTIKKMYGASIDFVVIINDQGQCKVLTERTDEVYKAAANMAIDLSSRGGQKFKGVYEDQLTGLAAVCMSQAMLAGVSISDLQFVFKPFAEFIDQTEPIKRLIGSGPTYQHRVFVTHDGKLGWTHKGAEDLLSNQLAKTERLVHIVRSQMLPWFRRDLIASLSSAVLFQFRTTDQSAREEAIAEVTAQITRKIQEYHHASYLLTLLIMAAAIIWLTKGKSTIDTLTVWQLAAIGGTLGAVISSLQRSRTSKFGLTQSRTNVIVQGLSRTLLGLASGLLIVVASKSGIAFTIISDNPFAITLVAFSAGFSERAIPDITAKVISNAD